MTADPHWSDSQAGVAIERGKAKLMAEPRAVAARYDAAAGRIIVDLTSGATFAFPPSLVEFLQDATLEQLTEVEVQGAGFGLHWETLGVDHTVPGLMNGIFGTARWMAARAGQATSSAKAQASRENGQKGGKPRKAG
ncbi:DUF2442 domain-containing protein [Blastomonas sp. AAP53]|uniref:DUF2442 domain-containing protein n=1 Tax=Blastomonas sp. AAP53 TaxID=1248760 RepID=UPI00037EE7BC|nr:DUF2442 domain-containing protein [Blastomonas sp. AAP53]